MHLGYFIKRILLLIIGLSFFTAAWALKTISHHNLEITENTYYIQLGAFYNTPKPFKHKIKYPVTITSLDDGSYLWLAGGFPTLGEAMLAKENLIHKGFRDAFIVLALPRPSPNDPNDSIPLDTIPQTQVQKQVDKPLSDGIKILILAVIILLGVFAVFYKTIVSTLRKNISKLGNKEQPDKKEKK